MKRNVALLEKGVATKETRFTSRALRQARPALGQRSERASLRSSLRGAPHCLFEQTPSTRLRNPGEAEQHAAMLQEFVKARAGRCAGRCEP